MTDHPVLDGTNDGARPAEPAARSSRPLATALAGVVALTVAGGWAYDHRIEYGIAYGQIFADLSDAYELSRGCAVAAEPNEEDPGCCHGDGTCLSAVDLTALAPVEAPKPPAALSEADGEPRPAPATL